MFSEMIKEALSHDVVGQPRAVDSVVRGVTRLMSGLTPLERSWCAYLFIGPPGTGRAHLVRTLARHLHGGEVVATMDCNPSGHADSWNWFVEQLAPLLERQHADVTAGVRTPNVVLVRDLECARKELFPALARMLETGQLALPGGRRGQLHNCAIFLTSALCTAEILESGLIGFAGGSPREGEEQDTDAIFRICRTEAENVFGLDLLAQIDNLVVFRRLEEEHLATVLERHFERMSRWLNTHGVQCELLPAAKGFLLERGMRQRLLGARDLILAHRQEVEFPLADLLVSRQLEPGGRVVVDHHPPAEHLHFKLEAPSEVFDPSLAALEVHEVPVR